jgi:hypothetical protein
MIDHVETVWTAGPLLACVLAGPAGARAVMDLYLDQHTADQPSTHQRGSMGLCIVKRNTANKVIRLGRGIEVTANPVGWAHAGDDLWSATAHG